MKTRLSPDVDEDQCTDGDDERDEDSSKELLHHEKTPKVRCG